MEYSFREMDEFIGEVISNFLDPYKKINLMNFDPKKESHMCGFEIAGLCSNLWGYEIYLQMKWFKFLIFKLKNRNIIVKRISPKEYMTEGPQYQLDEHLKNIAESLEYNENIIKQTYNAYYKKG